jgi:hypothetical protein
VNGIQELAETIKQLHGCDAVHAGSIEICEIFHGKTVWDGTVEIFDVHGHAQAKRCYVWNHWEGENGKHERIVTVLEVPPVDSPVAAVRAAVVADGKKRNRAN